jgi:hypothetical protein
MRGIPALRAILAVTVTVGACMLASGALAAPSAVPQPTPPPGGGGGGSSGGGGGGGGSSSGGGTTTRRPVGPVAVASGKAGAVLLEATGERTQEPVATTATPTTTDPPPTTTTEPPVTTAEAPVTTAEAPVTTAQVPATTAEIVPPPTTTEEQPAAAAGSGGDDSGSPSLPRDGIVVLVGVLLMGLAVAFRAIKARERRIGWALLGFCTVYLLALAGFMTGVAGAATANPGAFTATAGDGEVLLTFDAPPAGLALVVRRAAGTVPPAGCSTGTAVAIATPASGSAVDGPLSNGSAVSYRACLVDAGVSSSGSTASATPVSGVDAVAPRTVSRLVVRPLGGRVALAWRNPADRDYAATVVVRKFGSAPKSPTDGKVVYSGDRVALLDYPFSVSPVHYALFAVDEDGNAAAAVRAALPRFDPPLRTPFDRATAPARPRFTWKATAVDQYNVQVYRANRCCNPRDAVLNSYPKTASLKAPKRLARGTYVWYVFAHVKPGNAVASYKVLNTTGWRFTVR